MNTAEIKTHHSPAEWMAATRYWSFAVSAMPVIVTAAYLFSEGKLEFTADILLNFCLTLVGAMTLHAAGNVLSDWFDFRSGVDNKEAFAVRNLVFGEFTPGEYLRLSIILFVTGALIGIWLVFRCGLPLLAIGGAGIILTTAYSFLKYRALGDLDVFVIFSLLIMAGTSFVLTGTVVPELLACAFPVGIITVSVLHANNTLDIPSDGAAGIRTFAMVIGGKASCRLYQVYMALPFVCTAAAVACGLLHPLALLTFVCTPFAWKNFRQAGKYPSLGTEAVKGLDQASAKLQMLFSGLLSISLFLSALL